MVSLRDIEEIVNAARAAKARIVFRIRGSKYLVVIDGELKATDPSGVKVPWGRAFQRPPHMVLSQEEIESITVMCGENTVATYRSINELLRNMKHIKC